jgi:hypothetical protein
MAEAKRRLLEGILWTAGALAAIALGAFLSWDGLGLPFGLAWLWLGLLAGMLLLLALVGRMRAGRWFGACVNERNVASFARFQMLLWLVLLGSGVATCLIAQLAIGPGWPLALDADPAILGLAGITLGSTVAAPLILSPRQDKTLSPDKLLDYSGTYAGRYAKSYVKWARTSVDDTNAAEEAARVVQATAPVTSALGGRAGRAAGPAARTLPPAVQSLAQDQARLARNLKGLATLKGEQRDATLQLLALADLAEGRRGHLYGNLDPSGAGLEDLVTGDEVGNGPAVDAGKLQVALFTAILLAVYSVALFQLFASMDGWGGPRSEAIASAFKARVLPTLPESVVTLLSFSHFGYLGKKLVPATAG